MSNKMKLYETELIFFKENSIQWSLHKTDNQKGYLKSIWRYNQSGDWLTVFILSIHICKDKKTNSVVSFTGANITKCGDLPQ